MLTVITGPMYAGKTDELIRRIKRHIIAKRKVQLFTHSIDTRYGPGICTHDGLSIKSASKVSSTKDLIYSIEPDTLVIGVDEAEFFDKDLPGALDYLSYDLDVIVSCINLDSFGRPFEITACLLALADKILMLNAVCDCCGKDAQKTKRMQREKERIVVGGKELYKSVCKACYEKL